MAKKDHGRLTGDPVTYQLPSPAGGVRMETFIPWTLVKRGVRRQVITPLGSPQDFEIEAKKEREERASTQHSALLRGLGLAHYWQKLIDDGRFRSMTEIATVEELDLGQVSKIARLAQLAPDIIDACLADQCNGLVLEQLIRGKFALDWTEQRRHWAPIR
jgi:hypothetical protein